MASTEPYFPTGIVTGNAFCNRENERVYLKNRLEQNAHVVLMSPRRYGKSSLIAQFTKDQRIPFASIDLLPATSSKYVKNAIVDGVSQLLDTIMPKPQKAKQKIMGYLAKMNPTIELSTFGQKIKLKPEEKTPEETIMALLLSLNDIAKSLGKQLIFVMDEFQQIASLDNSHSLEASIRHAVERSRHVFYIFSGSNRRLLENMFKSKDRPLYHLCDEMKLYRITKEYYLPFIKKASKKTWSSSISEESINKLLSVTECHPYYVNRLCRALWDQDTAPTIDDIDAAWKGYVRIQTLDWVTETISRLTLNQKTVMIGLAIQPEQEPSGKSFSSRIEIPPSSIQRTITTLITQDLIYENKDGYFHVLNPIIKTVLANDKYF